MDVVVNTNPIVVEVFPMGIQGPPGPTTIASGQSLYYPLVGNPSGFVTAAQAGGILAILVGNSTISGVVTFGAAQGLSLGVSGSTIIFSGQDLSSYLQSSQTGAYAGTFYPLNSNPSNYITASQSGQFASDANLAATGANLSAWTGNATGYFYPYTGNPSSFITALQTGQLSNAFYPLNTNPNSYVTSGQTGNFISVSQTGQFYAASNPNNFVTSNQTGALTGKFYPLVGNPSSFIDASQTGQFYPLNGNPNSYITSGQTGIFVTSGQTGVFVTTGQTGQFYPAVGNPSLFVTSAQTGLLTGSFYPLVGNPSNFINSSQTGIFVTTSSTGIFVTTSQTGNFVTTNQTGSFSTVKVTGSNPITTANFTGVGGTVVAVSGNFITVSGAGGGISTITWGVTPTQGFTDGSVLFSMGGKVTGFANIIYDSVNGNGIQSQFYTPNCFNTNSRNMLDSNGVAVVDWENKQVLDGDDIVSVDWEQRWLQTNPNREPFLQLTSVDWQQGTLTNPSNGSQALNWMSSNAYDGNGANSIDWSNRWLYDGDYGIPVLDWGNSRLISRSFGQGVTVDWDNGKLYSYNLASSSIDWFNRIAYDGSNVQSLAWNSRTAHSENGTPLFNWKTGLFIQTGDIDFNFPTGLAIGKPITEPSPTFANVSINSNATGFYPSGSSHQYNVYAVKDWGKRGLVFSPATTSPTIRGNSNHNVIVTWGAVQGADYYVAYGPNQGPAGFDAYLQTTGLSFFDDGTQWCDTCLDLGGLQYQGVSFAYSIPSPIYIDSGRYVGINTSSPNYQLDVNGNINCSTLNCTHIDGQSANISSLVFNTAVNSNQSLAISINSTLGVNINGSKIITASQTGSFVTSGQTGSFITTSQTGQFYPRSGNISGFVLSTQTGNFNNTAANLGAGSGLYSGNVGTVLEFKSIIAGTGLQISGSSNDLTLNLLLGQTYKTGLQADVTMNSANTWFNLLSGSFGAGTYLVNSQVQFTAPNNTGINFYSKIYDGTSAVPYVCGGSYVTSTVTGQSTVDLTQLVTLTGTTNIVLAGAGDVINGIARSKLWGASSTITGSTNGTATVMSVFRLY